MKLTTNETIFVCTLLGALGIFVIILATIAIKQALADVEYTKAATKYLSKEEEKN